MVAKNSLSDEIFINKQPLHIYPRMVRIPVQVKPSSSKSTVSCATLWRKNLLRSKNSGLLSNVRRAESLLGRSKGKLLLKRGKRLIATYSGNGKMPSKRRKSLLGRRATTSSKMLKLLPMMQPRHFCQSRVSDLYIHVSFMGGLINPRPWRGQYRAGFSNTGGSPKPRKRAPCQKKNTCFNLLLNLLTFY